MYVNRIFAEKIDEELRKKTFPHQPENLYAPIEYMLNLSGKRIRPLLVFLGADLFGIKNIDDASPASMAIEYFHNFSLIHDDIMDKAPLRRGRQTVHQRWNDNVAILSGDALLIKAYEQLSQCPAHLVPDLLRIFNRVALQVCEGQQLDIDFEVSDAVRQEEYVNMIRLKTSVLLGGALEMGAVLAEVSLQKRTQLYEFGVNLGIAFQLQDDILDAFGNPATFGKQVGGDIIANKKTILYILLDEAICDKDRAHFDYLLSLGEGSASTKIVEMKALYEEYAIQQKADTLKEYYTTLAYKSLEAINVDRSRKTELYELANQLMKRVR